MMVDEVHNMTPVMTKDMQWTEKDLSQLAMFSHKGTTENNKVGFIMDLDNQLFPTPENLNLTVSWLLFFVVIVNALAP